MHLDRLAMKKPSGWVLECQSVWTVENVAFWTRTNALSSLDKDSRKRVTN